MRGLLVLVVCAASPAFAQADGGTDAPFLQPAPRFSVLLPAIESEALHFALAAINNLVLRETFAQISFDSIKSHFDGRRPWEFDVDYFVINQFGHPYQGALAFTAARSAGLSFWWASLYPFISSLTWEVLFEIDAPSYNDQITTPIGGVFLGEVLHRSALLLLNEGSGPRWLRLLGAFLIEPMGQLNRSMLDSALDANDVDSNPHAFGVLAAGVNIGTAFRDPNTFEIVRSFAPQANLQGRMTYGVPGDPGFRYRFPFSHFDVDFNLSFPGTPVSSLFIRGLLWGRQFGEATDDTRGVWGIFGHYDFASASLVRVSSVAFGVGTSFQTRLSGPLFLQLATMAAAVPYASAGSLGLEEGKVRDYHIGPGAQVTAEARLIWRDVGWLRVVARSWFTVGAYIEPTGWESITYVTTGPLVRLFGSIALGADAVLAIRRASFVDTSFDRSLTGLTARITLNWVSSASLGAVVR